jgi:shikimate kinase
LNNIYFIGLMGAGKTTIGRLLAKQMGREFYDSDVEIERKTGVRIPLIFELEGEDGFRKRETAAIEELSQLDNVVVATGGGAVLNPENRILLKSSGKIIYLRAKVHDLYQRTRNDKSRPLLQGANPKQKLEQLYVVRDPIYTELADYIVDTGAQSAVEITSYIEQLLLHLCTDPTQAFTQTDN